MPAHKNNLEEIALIAELVRRAPNPPGRTALMKFAYLLKTLRGVPLNYDFRLYNYGPFDSDVLDDLQYAGVLGAVESRVIAYPGGRGYEYRPGSRINEIEAFARGFLSQHSKSIDWVLSIFGNRSAQDLEMVSTLVFVDRAALENGAKQKIAELVKKVRAVKPYLSGEAVEREARSLADRGLLLAVAS